jgi:geranylgeranyl transferase type-1 subunit beta
LISYSRLPEQTLLSGINIEKGIIHILQCQTHKGGFAYRPTGEAHGAATFCSIAALDLWIGFGSEESGILVSDTTGAWLQWKKSQRLKDTCYSFWVEAPMNTLGWYDRIVNKEALIGFILSNFKGGMF